MRNKNNNSELRQDLVSGDWILIASRRGRRLGSGFYRTDKTGRLDNKIYRSKKKCPFENPFKEHQPILVYGKKDDWRAIVVENKYPALSHTGRCARSFRYGPYSAVVGVGHHDLVITRHHDRNFPKLSKIEANQVFHIFRDRYLMLLKDSCLAYIQIFHNWGRRAGASVYHPHYQIIALPVVPPDVKRSLLGSKHYFQKNKHCVHCDIIGYERRQKKRIVYENRGAIVFAPFVSREPFELRVFPKKHQSYFEDMLEDELDSVVEALQIALKRLEKKLGQPDYNFFIHTAPLRDKKNYGHYHWHIEILPQTNISAGFELGTGIEINVVDPDKAAKILRLRP